MVLWFGMLESCPKGLNYIELTRLPFSLVDPTDNLFSLQLSGLKKVNYVNGHLYKHHG